jgi:hypothetical protein
VMRAHPNHRGRSGLAVLALSKKAHHLTYAHPSLSDLGMHHPISRIEARDYAHSLSCVLYSKDFSPCYFEAVHLQCLQNLAGV